MSRQDDIKKLIVAHTRRKHELEMQRALSGYSTDPKVSIEIEDIQTEIEQLLVELKDSGEKVELPQSVEIEKIERLTLDFLDEISNAFLGFMIDPVKLLRTFYSWEQVVSPRLDEDNRKRLNLLEETIDAIAENGVRSFRRQDITKETRSLADNAKSKSVH